MAAPTIAALPSVPSRQRPTTFSNEADAFLNAFPTLRNEINAFSAYLNSTALVSYAFADGTAGLPTIRFESDSDTGIFRPTANTLAFSTAGVEAMRLDALGNLGLGTSSPTRKFHIKGSVASVRLEGTSVGGYLEFVTPNATNFIGSPAAVSSGSTDDLAVYVAGVESMRYVASGKIGIGIAIPDETLQIDSLARNGGKIKFSNSTQTGNTATIGLDTVNEQFILESEFAYPIAFKINGTEKARLHSSGSFLLNTPTVIASAVNTQQSVSLTPSYSWFAHNDSIFVQRPNGLDGPAITFFCGTNQVGSVGLTATATAYNTSSDYRLKYDWEPVRDASDRVMELNPVNFAWLSNDTRVDGFLAHEVAEIIPNAVTGKKDETDEDGAPVMQSVDHSKIVPLLTAALQEALKRIEALEAHVAKINGSRV